MRLAYSCEEKKFGDKAEAGKGESHGKASSMEELPTGSQISFEQGGCRRYYATAAFISTATRIPNHGIPCVSKPVGPLEFAIC